MIINGEDRRMIRCNMIDRGLSESVKTRWVFSALRYPSLLGYGQINSMIKYFQINVYLQPKIFIPFVIQSRISKILSPGFIKIKPSGASLPLLLSNSIQIQKM